MSRALRHVRAGLFALGVAACGGSPSPNPPPATLPTVDGSASTLTVSPASLPADGSSVATATVTVKATDGKAISGAPVVLNYSGTASIGPASATTSAAGVATFTLTSTTVGSGGVSTTINPGPSQVVLSPAAPLVFVAPLKPVPVTLELPLGLPDWLAFQDGDGVWELVQPITPTVTRDVLDPMGRYAWLCGSASGTGRSVDYYPSTAAEEPVMRLSIPTTSAATITVTGTVTGLMAGETARPFFNDSTLFAGTSATSSSGFSLVASPGTADLIFLIKDATGAPARMVRFNAINLSAGLAMTPIDLTPAAAVGTVPVFAAGVAADANVFVSTSLRTGNGTFFTVGSRSNTGLAVPLSLPSLPDTAWSTDDLMTVSLSSSDAAGRTSRQSMLRVAGPGPVTLELPDETVGLFAWTTYDVGPTYQYSLFPAAQYYSTWIYQVTATEKLFFYSIPSAGRFTTAVQSIPDFGAISGRPDVWGWLGSADTSWGLGASGGNVPLGPGGTYPPPAAGDAQWTTEATGSLLPGP